MASLPLIQAGMMMMLTHTFFRAWIDDDAAARAYLFANFINVDDLGRGYLVDGVDGIGGELWSGCVALAVIRAIYRVNILGSSESSISTTTSFRVIDRRNLLSQRSRSSRNRSDLACYIRLLIASHDLEPDAAFSINDLPTLSLI